MINKLLEWIEKDEGLIDFASYPLRTQSASSIVILKDNAVVSGISIVEKILSYYSINYEKYFDDGEFVEKGSVIFKLSGNAYNLLVIERTMLNILSIMSGVASKVNKVVKRAQEFGITIAATRKTIPLIGDLQKLAILHGSGNTHRLNLSDTVMIKDNHKKLYKGIKNAVESVKKIKPFTSKIEVEVENFEELSEALDLEVDIIMLDNFKPKDVEKAVEFIRKRNKKVIIEVSGGISEENIEKYLIKGIDVISIGKLTSEIKYVDFSMEII